MGTTAGAAVTSIVIVITWCWFWGVVAATVAAGRQTSRARAATWGALLGPLGVLVVVAMRPRHEH